ncbi:hypothetical protein BD626DRAFT_517829 [Schizophyllum amplum]|uniref:Uncharacterized protein n=1 Tax=Schizophyllum amplum TaxID=97359 RepID=A0A550BWA5_9AGAR|nr:hypothetical protein BD626DRAFT_517829 [Auriculariopsis ampla]
MTFFFISESIFLIVTRRSWFSGRQNSEAPRLQIRAVSRGGCLYARTLMSAPYLRNSVTIIELWPSKMCMAA